MVRWRRTTGCERAAQWISLELDDELSELESAALRRHLDRCAGCAAARAEIGGFTMAIRAAPRVPASEPLALEAPGARRVRVVRRAAATLALATALSAAAAFVVSPHEVLVKSSNALTSASTKQRLQFASAEQVRAESQALVLTAPAPPSPFAARVLS